MSWFRSHLPTLSTKHEALPGRSERMTVPAVPAVSGARLEPPFPPGTHLVLFGMGCFWGAERCFRALPGVYSTAVGYAGGHTPNPTYEDYHQQYLAKNPWGYCGPGGTGLGCPSRSEPAP